MKRLILAALIALGSMAVTAPSASGATCVREANGNYVACVFVFECVEGENPPGAVTRNPTSGEIVPCPT